MRIPDIPADILTRLDEIDCVTWGVPEPIQRAVPRVETLTSKMLPAAIAPWVFDIADRMQCPEDYPAVAALVATSSIIGTTCFVLPKAHDNWPVVPNLWGGVVGEPGALKTPALTAALEPVMELERRARKCHDAEMVRHASDELMYKMTRDALTKQLATALKGQTGPMAAAASAGGTSQQVSQLQAQLASLQLPEPPKLTRYKSNDTTVEKLLELLQENPRGLLVFRDELAGMFEQFDREDRVSDRAFYLEGWNGLNPYTSDRITRGTTHADAVCISLLGGIQPGKLEAYLSATMRGYDNDGLMQRLQLMVYPDRRPWKLVDRAPDYLAKDRAVDVMTSLADENFFVLGATVDGNCRQPYFRFSPQGQRLFNGFLARLQKKVDGHDHEIIRQHLAKYRSLMPSLALIFHLLDLVDERRQAERSGEPSRHNGHESPEEPASAGPLVEPLAPMAPITSSPISWRAALMAIRWCR